MSGRPRGPMQHVVLAALGYLIIGAATAWLGPHAHTGAAVRSSRVAAWLLSLAVFLAHLRVRRLSGERPIPSARSAGAAVALGALALAIAGPVWSHWNEPSRARLIALSVVAWPLLAGIPAFCAAYVLARAGVFRSGPAPHDD